MAQRQSPEDVTFIFCLFNLMRREGLLNHQSSFTVGFTICIDHTKVLLETAFQPHFPTANHFLTALQVANISIPLTPKFLKMTRDD